jgi:hypothetical protein
MAGLGGLAPGDLMESPALTGQNKRNFSFVPLHIPTGRRPFLWQTKTALETRRADCAVSLPTLLKGITGRYEYVTSNLAKKLLV